MLPTASGALKQLERAWRGIWIRVLTRLMRRRARDETPDWRARPQRVLFLRHDRIGDMILSTGLLRVIAESHPTIALEVLASPVNAPVLRADPYVRSVIVFDRAKPWRYPTLVRRLRHARYDAVIDCMPTAPSLTTLLLILASGARHRVGVAGRGNDAAFTLLVRALRGATHIADQLAALAAAFDVDPTDADFRPRLYLQETERARALATWRDRAARAGGRRALVNVSSGRSFRRWPDDRFVAAIRHLLAVDPELAVLVIGGPGEWDRAAWIAREAGVAFVRTASLRDALALVATADLVFTPDTGLAHAASAFDRPAVVLHIRGTAGQWGLYQSPGYEVSSPDSTLVSLPVEPVTTALTRLLVDHATPSGSSRGRGLGDEIGHFVR
jgi:ADP-heptose:LPS heptosyltransferase